MDKKSNSSKTEDNTRAPIVTIMGHVDHGKTSILDYIRNTNIQANEYGGITQHIGAYQVLHKDRPITFIDTPGHQAFSQMRARGGKAADIVVLVVAADSGVQPQTKEAIKHARAANVEIIVAINKMDVAGADPQKVKQQLAQENVLVEDWGGEIISVNLSAKTGEGIPDLLDAINAVAELKELRADPHAELEAIIIEAKLDKKRGVTVTCIIKSGTLRIGDEVSASGFDAKIRSIMDDKGNMVKVAEPSDPVEILGFKDIPNVGDLLLEQGSELAELTKDETRVEIIGKETKKTINIILKADTQGTFEAVKASLASLVTENATADFSLKFISSGTGDITDSDVLLASNTSSVVVGFNVNIAPNVIDLADSLDVFIKTYKTIYDLIDEVQDLLEGTATKEEKKIKGRARIVKTFKLPSGDIIAGCEIVAGALKPEQSIKIYAKNPADITDIDTPLYIGKIKKIKHGKNDIEVAGKSTECGVLLKPLFEEISADMWIEVK